MNDTPLKITEKMEAMIHLKTPAERLEMGCSMFDFSKQLVIHSILKENPGLSGTDLRKELFRVFYNDDFDAGSRKKITEYLSC